MNEKCISEEEGAWSLHDWWRHAIQRNWLQRKLETHPEIPQTYSGLVEALQKAEHESLLRRLFPFKLTENTLREGLGASSGEWEELTFNLAKAPRFSEFCGRKDFPDDMLNDAVKAMEEVFVNVWHFGYGL